jgi:hypothetical protein
MSKDFKRSDRDRLENIEPVGRRADDCAWNLRVPVDLLYITLALVNEQKLRWHLAFAIIAVYHSACLVLILLDSKIPKSDLVICTRGGKDGILGRVPFDGRNRRFVPVE